MLLASATAVRVNDNIKVVDLDGSFAVVDRGRTPSPSLGVYATWEEAKREQEIAAVEAEPWLAGDPVLSEFALYISRSEDIPYGSVIRRFEETGEDAIWLTLSDLADQLEEALELGEGGAGWQLEPVPAGRERELLERQPLFAALAAYLADTKPVPYELVVAAFEHADRESAADAIWAAVSLDCARLEAAVGLGT